MMIEVLAGCLSSGNFGASAEGIADGKFLGPSHYVLAMVPLPWCGAFCRQYAAASASVPF